MKEPQIFQLKDQKINNDISHWFITATQRDKITILRKLIHATNPQKAIVFINKNELIQDVSSRLNYHKINAECIYGNASKLERKKALDAFKTGKCNVLVASDLLARGLDLQDLTHVFNLDIPVDLNEYLHRVGRTGRSGKKGIAISIITENEKQFITTIERLNGIVVKPIELMNGEVFELKTLTKKN